MAYTNSPLVSYTKISPNKTSPRNHPIDTITIHCVVGQCSVETLGEIFAKESRKASSNYGIGADGRIGMYVEEKDRSWCSSNAANDHRAITIEVASDTTHPYKVNDKAYAALLDLLTDICKRNGIKKLLWKGDKSLIGQVDKQNMTVHRWFANKSCPGDYLYNKHWEIAEEVNKRLNADASPLEPEKILYRVQTGAFKVKSNADKLAAELKKKGFDTYIVQADGLFKVQVGAYSIKANADAMAAKLKAAGYDTFITTN
jgi:N-acetyl-anhydromuramyl-L-alanine amidase AmpD